jgi:cytochrome P450
MTQVDEQSSFDPDGFMDADVASNPQPYYRKARAQGAVVKGTWGPNIVTRSACEYAFQHPDEFSSGQMETIDLGQSVPMIPLQVDPPDHLKYRKLLDPIFAPRQMAKIEPDIARFVNELIDGFIDRGECDFSTELAVPLPSTVFLRLVGLPLDELDLFLGMKDGILRPAGADLDEMKVSQNRAAGEIEGYFTAAIDDRRRSPQDDLLSMFLQAEVDGEHLSVDEILGICFLFILAGLDTVTDSLECFYAYLARHPEHRQRIVDDPAIIPSAVEELLRWETPVTGVPRVLTKDLELDGCPLQKGDHVGVSIGSANTDEEALPDAYTVDFDRNPNKHLAFGGGIHRCLGSHLARLELRTTLREWHQRIPEYRLAEGATLVYQMGLRQIDSLPLVFGT